MGEFNVFLLKKELILNLRCAKENAVRYLEANTRDINAELTGVSRKRAFYGEVHESEFLIHNQQTGRRMPIDIKGRVDEIEKGCRIHICAEASSLARIFFYFSSAFVLLLLCTSVVNAIVKKAITFDLIFSFIFPILFMLVYIAVFRASYNDILRKINKIFGLFMIRE